MGWQRAGDLVTSQLAYFLGLKAWWLNHKPHQTTISSGCYWGFPTSRRSRHWFPLPKMTHFLDDFMRSAARPWQSSFCWRGKMPLQAAVSLTALFAGQTLAGFSPIEFFDKLRNLRFVSPCLLNFCARTTRLAQFLFECLCDSGLDPPLSVGPRRHAAE